MGQASRKEKCCTLELRSEAAASNLHKHSSDLLKREKNCSCRKVYPISPNGRDSKNTFENQIQKPKLLTSNGRSRSSSSLSAPSMQHILMNGRSRALPTYSSKKPVHYCLKDLETEFHRVLSEPVVKPVLKRPDVIRIKTNSVGTQDQQSADPCTLLSRPTSQRICNTKASDDTSCISCVSSFDSVHSDYESRNYKSIKVRLQYGTTDERIENTQSNSRSNWLNEYSCHSDSVLVQIRRVENTIDTEESSFSSFFCKKKDSRLKAWLKRIRRKIKFVGCSNDNKNGEVYIRRCTGHLS